MRARTHGLEAESPLAFAALRRLLLPVMTLRAGLPGPRARALRVVLGEEEGSSVEPFLVAVETLSMLTAAAEESLLLCVVDDAHWLDPATADALLFTARRWGRSRRHGVRGSDGAEVPFQPEGVRPCCWAAWPRPRPRALLDERANEVLAEEATDRLIVAVHPDPRIVGAVLYGARLRSPHR